MTTLQNKPPTVVEALRNLIGKHEEKYLDSGDWEQAEKALHAFDSRNDDAVNIIEALLEFVPEWQVIRDGKLVTSDKPKHKAQNNAVAQARSFVQARKAFLAASAID